MNRREKLTKTIQILELIIKNITLQILQKIFQPLRKIWNDSEIVTETKDGETLVKDYDRNSEHSPSRIRIPKYNLETDVEKVIRSRGNYK